MSSTFLGLTIGYSGLSAYQAALHTTGNNLANVKTEGYTRQQTVRSAAESLRSYTKYGTVGTGVNVTDIVQTRSLYYDIKYWNNSAALGEYEMKNYYMKQVQSYYYYDEENNGINKMLSQIKTSMQDLLDNSTDLSVRKSFISSGEGMADQLNEFAIALERLQKECNDQIKIKVDEVNNIARQIAIINKQINTVELAGATANELRDQRALLVDQLSAIAQVEVEESLVPSNMLDKNNNPIMTGATSYRVTIGGQELVSDFKYNQLTVIPRTERLNQSDAEGLYDIAWTHNNSFNMCSNNLGGELQGLIQMRDGNSAENLKGKIESVDAGAGTVTISEPSITEVSLMTLPEKGKITLNFHEFKYDSFEYQYDAANDKYTYTFHITDGIPADKADKIQSGDAVVGNTVDYMGIPYYMSMLNEFCRSYARAFNDIHMQGVDANGNQGGIFFTGKDLFSGEEFGLSDGDTDGDGTVDKISSQEDTYYCITAKNFRVAKALTKDASLMATASEIVNGEARTDVLEMLRQMNESAVISQYTPTEFFEMMLGDIAISTKDSKDMTENYTILGDLIINQRLSVSGVDEDEEGIDMVKFQNAYNLNSKMISILNECYSKLINETGVV